MGLRVRELWLREVLFAERGGGKPGGESNGTAPAPGEPGGAHVRLTKEMTNLLAIAQRHGVL